jgi:predicted CXXCH cytochrome family protein
MPTPIKAKEKAVRIPLDYFKTPDRLERWRRGFWIVAFLGVVTWVATGFSFGGSGWVKERDRLRYSHGPVARVHATWDAKCEACHQPFSPIRGEIWPTALGMKSSDADARCLACHQVADHSKNMKAAEVGSCASCHRDHQGREASLIDRADAQCVACHADLKSHVADAAKAKGFNAGITAFPGGHPDFAKLGDTGAIKFNHALHMTPGLNEAKDGKPILTLAGIAIADRERYRRDKQNDDAAVVLECASCHHLGSRAGSSLGSGGGAYYLPISYQKDCASCHTLDVALATGPPAVRNAKAEPQTYRVPHGLQPEAIRGLLTNASIGASMKATKATEPVRPLPGRSAAALSRSPDRDEIAGRAERILFGPDKATCTECHSYQAPGGNLDALAPGVNLAGVRVAESKPKAVWFEHAMFDHSSHRGVSCKSCHDGAYPDSAKPSRSSRDVLIVGKATCAMCHAPEGESSPGLAVGGASHSCVECHRFHGGGHGETTLSPDDDRTIEAFLRGSPPKPKSPAKAP